VKSFNVEEVMKLVLQTYPFLSICYSVMFDFVLLQQASNGLDRRAVI
jgi:hypothetical protein